MLNSPDKPKTAPKHQMTTTPATCLSEGFRIDEEHNPLRDMKRMIGNRALQRLAIDAGLLGEAKVPTRTLPAPSDFSRMLFGRLVPLSLQMKSAIDMPADRYEQEADRIAEQVVSESQPRLPRMDACDGDRSHLRKEQRSPEPPQIQRVRLSEVAGDAAPMGVAGTLRSPGQPLTAAVREFMGPRLGHDLGRVRIHAGADAARSAHALRARAYTTGTDIVFGAGEYAPESPEGMRLLIHELVHVVQQSGAAAREADMPVQRQSMTGAGANAGGVEAFDESINRAPGWIVQGGYGSQSNLRRMLRCQENDGECSEADSTLFNHPWFSSWYLYGAHWLRTMPQAEREEAIQFLVRLNTYEGRQQTQVLMIMLEALPGMIGMLRSPVTFRSPAPVDSRRAVRSAPPPVEATHAPADTTVRPATEAGPAAGARPPAANVTNRPVGVGAPATNAPQRRLTLIRGGMATGRASTPPRRESPAQAVPMERPLAQAVGSGISINPSETNAAQRAIATRRRSPYNPRQRGAYWRAQEEHASSLPFPTARNATPGRRTRGDGRGGVTRYDNPPSTEELDRLRARWFDDMRRRGTSREEVEGRMLSAGLSPNSPRWRRILDERWGPIR
jgi:hypothetical protein